MAYQLFGNIEASDYNGFIGSNVGNVKVAGELSSFWGRGQGDSGYGQVVPANVTAITDTVTATQWSTFFNYLNRAIQHQGGQSPVATLPQAGDTITYIAAVTSALTAGYTNRAKFTGGTTTTGTTFGTAYSHTTSATYTFTKELTVTFASADQARYFFNSGGGLTYAIPSITDTTGTTRGTRFASFAGIFGSKTLRGGNVSARTGTGGTVSTDSTTLGYWSLTTSNQLLFEASTGQSDYTDSRIRVYVRSNGQQDATALDKGTVITFRLEIVMGFQSAEAGLATTSDDIGGLVNTRVDIIYPETTYLTATWGTATVGNI
jgi:hypothetical protein